MQVILRLVHSPVQSFSIIPREIRRFEGSLHRPSSLGLGRISDPRPKFVISSYKG
ncbi:unnamed protein product [Penicillium nalgiovense]|nr:unnamed protein product [Penicillium nalgiovense]CAG8123504.1 unnamed protein product [Penicillium nalgiovense]CAG8157850.1 unnamed protein product [Penicillium nalgiovense]CAG8163124.1 unnamed protein product [Penicillium nalgiovense]CAG8166425.1 unnamed protein product [Penicillium nalgiovense]